MIFASAIFAEVTAFAATLPAVTCRSPICEVSTAPSTSSELSTEFGARSDAVMVASNSPALVTHESSSMFARKSASLLVFVAILFYIYPVSGRYRTTIFEPAGGAPPIKVNVVPDIV